MNHPSGMLALAACLRVCSAVSAAPDLIGGEVQSPVLWGTVDNVSAYSFGVTHCNVGTSPLSVVQNTNQHYVFTQNFYRFRTVDGAGRFEQLGQGWVFHSFCSLQTTVCAACSPACGGCCSTLGVGCSDSNTASRVGSSTQLGPRWEVNPHTAAFPFPFSTPGSGTLAGRVRITQSDLDPALNPGAAFFAEVAELAPDDASAGQQNNNNSYRRMNVGMLGANGYPLTSSGSTVRQQAAIAAWASMDPAVGATVSVDDPDGGRFVAASAATDLGGGQWRYEYAVYNLNSDRSAGSFNVPVPAGVSVSNIAFHDVDYHGNGNPYSGADWIGSIDANGVTWSTQSFGDNPNANALRWGTLYNFRFDANAAPNAAASASIGLFKPGTGTTVVVSALKAPAVPPPACPGDANGDLLVNAADLSVLLSNFAAPASGPGSGDFNNDGQCNGADLSVLLGAFGSAC